MIDNQSKDAIKLLKKIIKTPSFSKKEEDVVKILESWFKENGIDYKRHLNNLWAGNKYFNKKKPTILLNSHHDTVQPNKSFTIDPFYPTEKNGKIFGLGSNDAGGALVSLLYLFKTIYLKQNMKYNFIIACTAEEEIAGTNGIKSILKKIPKIDFGIIGEPTQMKLSIAERGLIVFDAKIKGKPSHAAHENIDNAIEKLPKILNWFNQIKFDRVSKLLGPVKTTITQINAGFQHNVIPSEVDIVVDVRINELYDINEINDFFVSKCPCEIKARSLNLRPSSISSNHKIVKSADSIGIESYGSPTLSDQALLDFPSVKIGPGNSKRSHSADEYIYVDEVKEGIEVYKNLLNKII